MDCDIHIIAEIRCNDSAWDSFGDYEMIGGGRDYLMFSIMAGVRGRGYKFDPRGIPVDASHTSMERYKRWEGDTYGASWLTYKEFLDCFGEYKRRVEEYNACNGFDLPTDPEIRWRMLLAILEEADVSGYEARIVFWFDN